MTLPEIAMAAPELATVMAAAATDNEFARGTLELARARLGVAEAHMWIAAGHVLIAFVIGAGQIGVVSYGIWVMRGSNKRRADEYAAAVEANKQRAKEAADRHEEAMTALKALIERTAPPPANRTQPAEGSP